MKWQDNVKVNRWKLAQVFEILWWKKYLAGKDRESYLKRKKEYWRRFLNEAGIAWPAASESILDAGGGPAGIFIIFQGLDVTMCDPLMEKYSDELDYLRESEYQGMFFYNTKIEEFDPGRTYDTVFCLNVINHVESIEAALEKLYQLTSDGGRLIIATDCHNYSWLKSIFAFFQFDVLHPHQYTSDEYVEMFLRGRELRMLGETTHRREAIFSYKSFVLKKGYSG